MGKVATLALEDGSVYVGKNFGAEGECGGEVVFNTSMTGYQEILTDPSYHGQIVVMTYPHIGNYGVNDEDYESSGIHVEGFVVREYSRTYSNWRATSSLDELLKRQGIVGIEGIDTRALVKRIRDAGSMRGVISTDCTASVDSLVLRARSLPSIVGRDLVQAVATKRITKQLPCAQPKYRIGVIDFGVKRSILELTKQLLYSELIIFPPKTSPATIKQYDVDGLLLSNGPGDPAGVDYAVDLARELVRMNIAIFGICLGHQILALALGAKRYKLKFGHHGANHPVKNLKTQAVEITSQNHCFAIDIESLKGSGLEPTHINLNDDTLEGMRHIGLPIMSVQYHPEAAPGPHDSRYLFYEFKKLIESSKNSHS